MKNMFPEYYYEPDFDKLWEQAIFVFDANVLLDIFRFSPKTSGELIEILEGLKSKDRIWMPYQFAYEYHKNLMPVQKAINGAKGKIKTAMQQHKKIKEELNRLSTRAGFKVNETHIEEIKEVEGIFEKILQDLSNFENEYKSKGDGDLLAEKIAQLFAGNVGEYNSDPRIENISSIGKQRFDRKIPPGFKDANKPDPFGDLVGWFQMIAHAKEESRPLILVSNDRKGDDWFLKQNNQLKGPRPELRKEMCNEANVDFYLYTTKAFMEQARDRLKSPVSNETIEEMEQAGLTPGFYTQDLMRIMEQAGLTPGFYTQDLMRIMEQAGLTPGFYTQNLMEQTGSVPKLSSQISPTNDDEGDMVDDNGNDDSA